MAAVLAPAVSRAGYAEPVWSRAEHEVYSPRFSPDGRRVAFVINGHWPDGGELVGMDEKRYAELRAKLDAKTKADPRWNDPRIVVLDLDTKKLTEVDFGYDPAFSPDGATLAYQRQKKVITGRRILADTLEGNSICLWHSETGKSEILIEPEKDYLASPLFSPDGRKLAYAQAGHANGAWGGDLGVMLYDFESKKSEPLPPPPWEKPVIVSKAFRDQHLVVCYWDGVVIYEPKLRVLTKFNENTRYKDHHMAVLMNGDICVTGYPWKNLTSGKKYAKIKADESESMEGFFQDPRWHGAISPTGTLIALAARGKIRVYDTRIGHEIAAYEGGGRVSEIVWRADGAAFAVVATNEDAGFCDQLFIFNIAPDLLKKLPAARGKR